VLARNSIEASFLDPSVKRRGSSAIDAYERAAIEHTR
jgi:hypothetical protein